MNAQIFYHRVIMLEIALIGCCGSTKEQWRFVEGVSSEAFPEELVLTLSFGGREGLLR